MHALQKILSLLLVEQRQHLVTASKCLQVDPACNDAGWCRPSDCSPAWGGSQGQGQAPFRYAARQVRQKSWGCTSIIIVLHQKPSSVMVVLTHKPSSVVVLHHKPSSVIVLHHRPSWVFSLLRCLSQLHVYTGVDTGKAAFRVVTDIPRVQSCFLCQLLQLTYKWKLSLTGCDDTRCALRVQV